MVHFLLQVNEVEWKYLPAYVPIGAAGAKNDVFWNILCRKYAFLKIKLGFIIFLIACGADRRKFFEISTILTHFQGQFLKLFLHTGGFPDFPHVATMATPLL